MGQEFKKIAVACAIGFSIMGFIGRTLSNRVGNLSTMRMVD